MNPALHNVYAHLKKRGLDGLIVSSPFNISYLTDYTSRDSYLIVSKKGNIYITDSRHLQEANDKLGNRFAVEKINGSAFKIIAKACQNLRLRRIGFEERHLPFGEYKRIKINLPKDTKLSPVHGIAEGLRQIKNPAELKKIKKAVQITVKALTFIKKFISAGKKEIEIAAELEHFIRYNGGSSSAFEIIVASGPNSSFPHHITSQRRLKNNEPVLVDIGVNFGGYKSDLTRVFFLGKMTTLYKKIYAIVLKAQSVAIKKIKPDAKINKVDAAARQCIAQQGYGGFFGHSLGHGVGLEVHEAPHISGKETGKLKPGMVFTVEPAVYLPHKFGIRIEDMALVTAKGVKVLSGALDK